MLTSGSTKRLALTAAFILTVLLTGTTAAELIPALRVLGTLIAAVFVVAWVLALRRGADRVDLLTTAALVLFVAACLLSLFPRQSLDAALGALAWVATFGVARRALAVERIRNYGLVAMASVAVTLTVVIVAVWGATWLHWLSATGWSGAPPLDLDLPSGPWAHQHDLTVLLVILAPSVWLIGPSGWRRRLAALFLVAVAAAVLMDGSRSVWLALAAALPVAGAPRAAGWLRASRRVAYLLGAAVFGLAVAVMVSGLGSELIRRLSNLQTLSARAGQWEAAFAAWAAHPLQGAGPGAFSFILRTTDYFHANTYVSRHPDNAYVQLVAGAGLLGMMAGAIVLYTLVRHARRSREYGAATFALAFAAVAAVGTNPFEYAFILAPLTAWAAMRTPFEAAKAPAVGESHRPRRLVAVGAALVIIAAAQTSVNAAAIAYQRAADEMSQQAWGTAREALSLASTLDPGMALYARELGAADLLAGRPRRAATELERAIYLNSADDVAFRVLALALGADGRRTAALGAAQSAAEIDPSDPANLIVLARASVAEGMTDEAAEALTLAVAHAPLIVADPTWKLVVPAGTDAAQLERGALALWQAGEAPWAKGLDPYWLALVSSQPGATIAPQQSSQDAEIGRALTGVLSCETSRASLITLAADEGRFRSDPSYWPARVFAQYALGSSLTKGQLETAYLRVPQLQPVVEDRIPAADLLSGRFKDQYGYGRLPLDHGGASPAPSNFGGFAAWVNHPHDAAGRARLSMPPMTCGG